MSGRYGGDIRGQRRREARPRQPWTPPAVKAPRAEARRPYDPKWALIALLGAYAFILGAVPLALL